MASTQNPTLRRLPALLFFLSGFCGLLYQLIWMRLAFAAFGINTPVMSVVISVFMAGLALGSWWGGAGAARWMKSSARMSLYRYALAEALIGLGAFAVPLLFNWGAAHLLPLGESDSTLYLFWSALALGAALFPWCFFMGATFPLMLAYLEKTSPAKENFSFLYTANVLGALTGVGLTAAVLVECLGFHRTLAVGAALNGLISLLALVLSRFTPASRGPVRPAARSAAPTAPSEVRPLPVLFLTGFISMAMEVIWTRDFSIILETQVYSFAALLFVYLLSTFLGSWFYRRQNPKQVFSNQALLSAAFLGLLASVVFDDPRINHTIAGVLLSIAPFCALLGYLTPKLVDQFSAGNPAKAGRAYALNVLGCILGPLAAAYLLLPALGVRTSLVVLSLPLVPYLIRNLFPFRRKLLSQAAPALLGGVLLAFSLGWSVDYEEGFHLGGRQALLRRDYAATVISLGTGMNKKLFVNGIGITDLCQATKDMAHLPLAFLPRKPQKALGICFGMGTTFRSLMSWGLDTTHVELVPSVLKAFDFYFSDADALKADPRAHLVVDDGRRFLKRTDEKFDLITVDPPPPWEAAGSSLLYSVEFYSLVKEHLTEGGILQQWFPGGETYTWRAAAQSLKQSFPYLRVFVSPGNRGCHFIASLSPIPALSAKELARKLPPAAVKDLMEWAPGPSPEAYFKSILAGEMPVRNLTDPLSTAALTDDRPYNEYYLLRRLKLRFPSFL